MFIGNEKIVEILVENGADVNIRAAFDKDTALAIAALNGWCQGLDTF